MKLDPNKGERNRGFMALGCFAIVFLILAGWTIISTILGFLNTPSPIKNQSSQNSSSKQTSQSINNNSNSTTSSTTQYNQPTNDQNQQALQNVANQLPSEIQANNYGAFLVNNNQATIKAKNSEQIFAANTLDKQHRPGVANAFLTKQARQYKSREETNNGAAAFKPAGYHQLFNLPGHYKYAYNRGHLLGYALVGNIKKYNASENNAQNIITQTSWSNQAGSATNTGQNYYESLVRKALDQNKKVAYQVKPLYNGNDLVASGVQIQAISTDKTLDFNVFIPNTQDNINIDYSTGNATKVSN